MIKGTVERYNEQNGFGFIKSEAGESVFVHYTGIEMGGFKKLTPGQKVEFVIVEGQKGPQAARVRPVSKTNESDSQE
ncbi:cold-shock protein [Secundilactobacillus pentosiphilus]|uniref:Cold-shock protein n=1 Tax=Secundilactobacillus pentosiphilus TaxID=1714682 RepID=A0A1Z5IPB5_9LACO|nr:cold shock domain-containing protein [Secundilactobacillus pentosiphilus]GAX03597.1 cold-shock protein [Secundilactobacillus pentosiphilus]